VLKDSLIGAIKEQEKLLWKLIFANSDPSMMIKGIKLP